MKNRIHTSTFNNIFAKLMVNDKGGISSILSFIILKKISSFFKYNTKKHFMFAVCGCLNYTFLLIIADVIDNRRINQTWKQIPQKILSQTRKFWKSIFRIFMFHESLQKVYHEHFSVVYTMKLSWNRYFMKCFERNISQCILTFRSEKISRIKLIVKAWACIWNRNNSLSLKKVIV